MSEYGDNAFQNNDEIYYKPIESVPMPERNIGIDTSGDFYDSIVEIGDSNSLDISAIESFSSLSQKRDEVYKMIDTMMSDTTMSSAIDLYAEDATERNDEGRIVWATSSNKNVSKYVTYLLDSMNIDKNAYNHIISLIKYGDLYLRLYRQSEYKDDIFGSKNEEEDRNLNEDVNIKVYNKKKDGYAHYIEKVADPSTMFELTKFGKTCGYINAPHLNSANIENGLIQNFFKYNFNKNDIDIYEGTEFVHACLGEEGSRVEERVNISIDGDSNEHSYVVRRGRSAFYDTYKIWRQLSLLENSIVLNRITKSSIVRIIGVEVGDMPKEQVKIQLRKVKNLIEQKTSVKDGDSMGDYANPGPIENNVYLPTKDGKGAVTATTIGGDVDVKSLADLEYFKNKFYGSIKIPKQFMGDTDDAAGFSGGESLAIVSSRYAKTIKKVQDAYLSALTDAINLMLIDKGLTNYIGDFTLNMVAPTTKEETDRRANLVNRVGMIRDIRDVLGIDDEVVNLKVVKALLSGIITDEEISQTIDEYIDKKEKEQQDEEEKEEDNPIEDNDNNIPAPAGDRPDFDINSDIGSAIDGEEKEEPSFGEEENDSEEVVLPSADELGIDATDNGAEEFQ